jgi:hypothetical protein
MEAVIEADFGDDAPTSCSSDDRAELGARPGGGFLDEHVFTSLDHGQGGARQRVMGRSDDDGLDVWVLRYSAKVIGCQRTGMLRGERFSPLKARVDTQRQYVLAPRFRTFFADRAATDHCDSHEGCQPRSSGVIRRSV